MSLKDKILKNSKLAETAVLTESRFFQERDYIPTRVPLINLALSGRLDGGMSRGFLMIGGQSKHFKTGFALLMASAFLKKYPEGIIRMYDTEFGSPSEYFGEHGIAMDQVVHSPVSNIELMKQDVFALLESLEKNDKVFILVDSLGNLASNKEIEDTRDEKIVGDMSRSKAMKSLFRVITPLLHIKGVPMVGINHTYKTQEMYSKDVVSGGTGAYYNADDIWIVGRRQDKEDKELKGFTFVVNIEKSRSVKEGSKFPIEVSFEDGINVYSGMFDEAVEAGFITCPSKGWYEIDKDGTPVKCRRADIEKNEAFWSNLLKTKSFQDYLTSKYTLVRSKKEVASDE